MASMHIDNHKLWYALYSLEIAYWHDVDRNGGRNAHEFYVPDGVMVVGHNRFEGRDHHAPPPQQPLDRVEHRTLRQRDRHRQLLWRCGTADVAAQAADPDDRPG